MERYEPEASWGGLAGAGLGVLIALALFGGAGSGSEGLRPLLFRLSLLALFAYLLFSCLSLHYCLDDTKLTICYGSNQIFLPLAQLAPPQTAAIHLPALRGIGLGWPGFHLGPYSLAGLGVVSCFATHLIGEVVVLDTARRRFIVTPRERERFIRELKRRQASLLVLGHQAGVDDKAPHGERGKE